MPDSIIKADNISSLSGGGIGFPDGSVSSPSMKFTNDGDTGLYRIGSNTIGIATNGAKVGEIGADYGGFTGNVLQVVQASDNSYSSVSSALYTWLSLTITRKLSTSKILAMFSGNLGTGSATDVSIKLKNAISGYISIGNTAGLDNSSSSIGTDKGGTSALGGTSTYFMIPCNVVFLHTPTTALSQTYSIDIWAESTITMYPNGDGWRGGGVQSHNTQANLILMEIFA
jgi:hypothetical protein